MIVKNINGTTDNTCRCASWLEHWSKFAGQNTAFCQAKGCWNMNPLGAHVQKGGQSADARWYIYPLCAQHNKHEGELEVSDAYKLASGNVSETCGKE